MQSKLVPDIRLETFREVSMEFDAVYGMLAKSCGLSGTEYWALILIYEGVETQREISEQLSLSRRALNPPLNSSSVRDCFGWCPLSTTRGASAPC